MLVRPVLSSLVSRPVRVSLSIFAKASLVGAKRVRGARSAKVSSGMLAAWIAATRVENWGSDVRIVTREPEPVGVTVTGLTVLWVLG